MRLAAGVPWWLAWVGAATGCGSPVPPCDGAAGAYQLAADDGGEHIGGGPWVYLFEDDGRCVGIVSSAGFPARAYSVELTRSWAVLEPVADPARGGRRDLTEHSFTDWLWIALRRDGGGLAGEGAADVLVDWDREDIFGSYDERIRLTTTPAGPGELDPGPFVTLPWRPVRLGVPRPVPELAAHLATPSSAWTVEDVVEPDGIGVIHAMLSHRGEWDEVMGQSFSVARLPSLVDLAGQPLTGGLVSVSVRDVGPALEVHEMRDLSTVASWGHVQPYAEGDCATLGCVRIDGDCRDLAGVAGQLRTAGMTEAVLSMREGWPAVWRIEVVAPDGTSLPPVTGGEWVQGHEQVWTYDVSGHDTVGFAIEGANYCHGWADAIVVESVSAR